MSLRLLCDGKNTVRAVLGDGWYAGRLGWMGLAQYGTRPVFNAQLEIAYADGTTETIATDDSWQAGAAKSSARTCNGAKSLTPERRSPAGISLPLTTRPGPEPLSSNIDVALVPQLGPPVRELLELVPQKISRLGDVWIVDFGQNLVGFVRLTVRGPAGTTITLRHGEMLNPDGSLYTENLRPAMATDTFILKGRLRARKRSSRISRSTVFGTSKSPVIPGRFRPMTCAASWWLPIRRDRDFRMFESRSEPAVSEHRLGPARQFPERADRLSAARRAHGLDGRRAGVRAHRRATMPTWPPSSPSGWWTWTTARAPTAIFATSAPRIATATGRPGWGDAGVICPWEMYTAYGDKEFLADHYPAMVRWVEYCRGRQKI